MKRSSIILFNCSTNVVGGGVKNSVLFIKQAMEYKVWNWRFAISEPVSILLKEKNVQVDDRFKVFINSPARSKKARTELLGIVSHEKIEIVYTMAGPAYVKFPVRHIQGISNAYITHADFEVFWLKKNALSIARYMLYVFVQFLYSKRADYFVFQTEQARQHFSKRAFLRPSQSTVIPNAFDQNMVNELSSIPLKKGKNQVLNIFCPGAAYVHKAFQFLPSIAQELVKIGSPKFEFVLTLPKSDLWNSISNQAKKLGLQHCFRNIGPYSYAAVSNLYADADVVFVPSLLETFSASYLEAIAAKKSLVVADKGFAKEICGKYAKYVDSQKAKPSAEVLKKVMEDVSVPSINKDLALEILQKFGNQEERFLKICNLIENELTKHETNS